MLIEELAENPVEQVSKGALLVFHTFISRNHQSHFRSKHWDLLVKSIENLIELTLPRELAEYDGRASQNTSALPTPTSMASKSDMAFSNSSINQVALSADLKVARLKSSIHLVLIQTLKDLFQAIIPESKEITLAHICRIVEALGRSAKFAQDFNEDIDQRQLLLKSGFLPSLDHIMLSKQEAFSLQLMSKMLIGAFLSEKYQRDPKLDDLVTVALRATVLSILENYMEGTRMQQKCWPPVISSLIQDLSEIVLHAHPRPIPWLAEFYPPILSIFKQDNSIAADSAKEFLLLLCEKYIAEK